MHARWLVLLLLPLLACPDPRWQREQQEKATRVGRFPDPKAFPPRAAVQFDPRQCNPDAFYRVDPVFPADAAEDRSEGWVLVSGLVDRDGLVRDPVVLAADPEEVFDRAALRAFAQWRYCAPDPSDERPEVRTVLVFKRRR
jgi:TonB family protein